MEQGRGTAVRTESDATVDDDTVPGCIVPECNVFGPKSATVFDSTVSKNIVEFSAASQQKLQKTWKTIWKYCAQ